MGNKLVSVAIITYNHEHYIKECIESIVAQIVDFDYEIVIGQDCSTDATHAVCLHYAQLYPDLIRYNQRTRNLGMMGNWMATIKECTGKYIALCEGDDYWTDPYKLQKQVDFLEANEDYAICWTKYMVKNESIALSPLSEPEWSLYVERYKDLSFDLSTIFKPYCTYTLTALFRAKDFDVKLFSKLKYVKDNTLYAMCLSKGKGMLLNFTSAVYRVHNAGIYSLQKSYINAINNYLNFVEIIITFKDTRNNHFFELMQYFKCELRSSLKQHNKEFYYYYYLLKGFNLLVTNNCINLFKYI